VEDMRVVNVNHDDELRNTQICRRDWLELLFRVQLGLLAPWAVVAISDWHGIGPRIARSVNLTDRKYKSDTNPLILVRSTYFILSRTHLRYEET